MDFGCAVYWLKCVEIRVSGVDFLACVLCSFQMKIMCHVSAWLGSCQVAALCLLGELESLLGGPFLLVCHAIIPTILTQTAYLYVMIQHKYTLTNVNEWSIFSGNCTTVCMWLASHAFVTQVLWSDICNGAIPYHIPVKYLIAAFTDVSSSFEVELKLTIIFIIGQSVIHVLD